MSGAIYLAANARVNAQFHGVYTNTDNNASKRTFNSVPFGNPSADRRVIVGVICAMDTDPTVTIGGNAASNFGSAWTGTSGAALHGIVDYSDNVTSGTVEVTPPISSNGMIVGVWSISRRSSVTDFTATHFQPNTTDTLDIEDLGCVFGIAGGFSATSTGQFSLSSHATDFDQYLSGNGLGGWGGRWYTDTDNTGETITATTFGSDWAWAATSYGRP